jgi:beta-xylosidase
VRRRLVLAVVALLLVAPATQAAPPANPAWRGDFPDPFVLVDGGSYHAYATNAGDNVQQLWSSNLGDWRTAGDAKPLLPTWAEKGWTWAPTVLKRAGSYVLYDTVRDRATQRQCISRAVGASPAGPFVDASLGPMVCQWERGGSIDPSPFVDADGSAWLLWKSEGTARERSRIWTQRLTDDGLATTGPMSELVTATQGWERGVVEAPAMVRQGRHYLLLYSGNGWWTRDYAVGFALCDSVRGPCRKPLNRPVLASRRGAVGPGSAEVFTDTSGGLRVAYHAWPEGSVGYPRGKRVLHIDALHFFLGVPVIG